MEAIKIGISSFGSAINRVDKTEYFTYRMIPFLIMGWSLLAFSTWYMSFDKILRISDEWVTMKPVTALCFFFCALAMLFHIFQKPRARDFTAGVFSTLACASVAAWAHSNESLNAIPHFAVSDEVYSLAKGVPSWPTIFLFMVFCLSFFTSTKRLWGSILMMVSGCALLGYGISEPALFFYWEGHSTAMALPTAVLFLHQGIWMYPFKDRIRKLLMYIIIGSTIIISFL